MNISEKSQKEESEQPDINFENQAYVRRRTRASAEQLTVLEDTFSVNVSPNSKLRKKLAEQLKMSERSIQIWFQNRRAKVKHMQKRAQMQMQQAAIRAQLCYFHQQQQRYGMIHHYSTAPSMIPNQSAPYYNYQQPPYFSPPPPPPQAHNIPLTRAKSVDAISYYGNNPPLATADSRQSSLPTLTSELLPNSNVSPSTADMPQHGYPMPFGENRSVSPNPALMESPVKITKQSMPPYDSFSSQAFQNNNIPPNHAELDTYVDIEKQLVQSGNPLDLNDGQIALSPSPIEDSSSKSSSILDDSSQNMSMNKNTSNGDLNEPQIEAKNNVPATDIWVSSPVEEQSEQADINISDTSDTQGSSTITIDPANLTIAKLDSLGKDYINYQLCNASTLTIGSWHRVKMHTSDLLCIYHPNGNVFEWLITERDCRFKVVILCLNVLTIEYCLLNATSTDEANAEVHFYLSHFPLFYMESIENGTEDQWIQCSDFTENKQASRYLRHTWKGKAHQMKQDLNVLISKHSVFKDKIHFINSSSQNQFNIVASNGPFVSSQQQQDITANPFVSYNPYYNYYSEASPMPLSVSPNGGFCSSIDLSSTLMMTQNKVTRSGFYS